MLPPSLESGLFRAMKRIPGVTCVKPQGALYAFPRLDPEVHEIRDDGRLVYDFLVAEHEYGMG